MLMKAKSRRPTLFVWARLLRLLIPGDQAQITLNGRDGEKCSWFGDKTAAHTEHLSLSSRQTSPRERALLLRLLALRHKLCRSYKLRGEVVDIVQFAKSG
jgi:hypothetical protein